MIDSAITHLANQLNQYLRRTVDLNEDIVVVSNIVEQDGQLSPHVNNKLLMFLINITKDTVPTHKNSGNGAGADRSTVKYPPLFLNLHLMIAGHFNGSNYPEALKFISHAVSFFQRRPLFDHHNTPDLDNRIEKLILDMENLSVHDLSTLWGVLSGKYLPSVLYRVRMVAYDADDVVSQAPTLKAPEPSVAGSS